MKIQFRTIEIERLVISYMGILGCSLILYSFFSFSIHKLFFLLLPVLLYFLFRGKVEIEIRENYFYKNWCRKPLFGNAKNKSVDLSEVIRWKYEHTFRGPDRVILILESGEKIRINIDLFVLQDVETILTRVLNERISEVNSNLPEERRFQKIKTSGYIKKLDQKIAIVKLIQLILLSTGIILLLAGGLYPQVRTIWVFFFITFCCFFPVKLFHTYLQHERKKTFGME